MHDAHLVNVLGACSLAISGLTEGSVCEASGTSRSGAAALAVLLQAGNLSVTELGRRVGLSQPAAARMVDTLERDAHAKRTPGHGREVQVELTARGRRAARRLLQGRSQMLARLVEGIDEEDQQRLAALLGTIAANVYEMVGSADLICRLCDRHECVSRATRCPVGVAAGESPGA